MPRHLIIGAEQWVPWIRITENATTGTLEYSGIVYNILLALSQTMNFTYELRRPPDGLWGVGFPNGSWSGMLGMVKRREVDFALGPFAFNWERYHYACEFTQPIFVDYESVFMRRPRVETDLFAFIKPFTWQVWVCLLGAIVFTWLTLVLFHYLSPFEVVSGTDNASDVKATSQGELQSMSESGSSEQERHHGNRSHLFFVLRSLSYQTNTWLPQSDTRRVITATWLISCLILGSVFSGTLTAMLTVPLVRIPIDSTEDLVRQREIPWAIESGSFLFQVLFQATSGIYKAIWDGHSHRITDCYSYRQDIKAGLYAAVCDKMTMKKVMSEDYSDTGECNFYMAREDWKSMPLALAFQHGHSLYGEANEQILQMIDKGLVGQWIEQQIPNGTACLGQSTSGITGDKRALSLEDYYGLFLVFAACMVAWSFILVAEIMIGKRRQNCY
ncbi:glutamate receptor ionotropic, delta-2-like isoform X2 [Macrobrachium rosenbergii]|uniref:glutamate receptor ionotropic, delta-2-like isoform X2 n=1 Tax=Macrobrachium rosenbergii TaxID=79674 RepID=UPI0034D7327F